MLRFHIKYVLYVDATKLKIIFEGGVLYCLLIDFARLYYDTHNAWLKKYKKRAHGRILHV